MKKKNSLKHYNGDFQNLNTFLRPLKIVRLLFILVIWGLSKIGQVAVNLVKFCLKNLRILFNIIPSISLHSKPKPIIWWGKLRGFRIAVSAVIILVCFFFYSLFLIIVARDLPNPQLLSQSQNPQTTMFYDRNGKLLYRLYEGKNRTKVKLEEIPRYLINATISVEDKNFYSHSGVDFYGIARSILAFIQNHEIQGGSTITQQLVKNTLLTPERTIQRKIKELAIAFWTERIFSKDEILQMYFNEAPFGGPAWGVAAAAQTYFNKNVSELTLSESAYLAGLPASPTSYSPYGISPELGKTRQKEVLRRMAEERFITKDMADSAFEEQLDIKPPISSIKAPHFVMYVRSMLASKYGEKMVSQGGLKIYTTLDLDVQNIVEKAVSDEIVNLANLDVSNGAAMVLEGKTGHILAMVGSRNYWDSASSGNYNVTLAKRQPGSSIKPITYATSFKLGYSPGFVLDDGPISFKNAWENYTPVNYDGRFHGPVTIRTALGSSYNIPAVKMLNTVGIDKMIQTARDLGITTFDNPGRYGLSLTLGGGEVRMIDMMGVYGVFSQMGIRYEPQPILKILDSEGQVLEDNLNPDGIRVLPTGIAYLITDILADNNARTPAFGPNSLLNFPNKSVAVKTGTSDNKRDNWTFGFTPEIVVGVWVGNNDNHPMNPALTSGITGAAPIWNKIMTELLENKPDIAFVKPDDVTYGIINGHKDLIVSGITNIGLGSKWNAPKASVGSITFTDPLSTFQTDQSGQPQIIPH